MNREWNQRAVFGWFVMAFRLDIPDLNQKTDNNLHLPHCNNLFLGGLIRVFGYTDVSELLQIPNEQEITDLFGFEFPVDFAQRELFRKELWAHVCECNTCKFLNSEHETNNEKFENLMEKYNQRKKTD